MRDLLAVAGAKGVEFSDFDIAFVHESAVGEKLADRSNERLEFLGDAVLGSIVARSLFERYPDAPEGELALRKSALVSDMSLSATAQRLGFDPLLITGSALASGPIERRRSLLSDAFEAFVALLATRCGLDVAFAFVTREHIDVRERDVPIEDDPKTVLQEWSQRRFHLLPTYTESFEGPDHARVFVSTVEVDGTAAQGQGHSKKTAQREAATAVLALLREKYDDVSQRSFSKAAVPGGPSRRTTATLKPAAPKRKVGVYKKKAGA